MLLDAGAGAQAAAGAKRKVCLVEQSEHMLHPCAWRTYQLSGYRIDCQSLLVSTCAVTLLGCNTTSIGIVAGGRCTAGAPAAPGLAAARRHGRAHKPHRAGHRRRGGPQLGQKRLAMPHIMVVISSTSGQSVHTSRCMT